MTRVLVDTTYLLPVAGVEVRGVQRDALRMIRAAGHEVSVSDISVFELLAKGAKLVAEGKVDEERISLGVQSILRDESIQKVSAYSEGVARTAVKLRRLHSDFVDCLILASALDGCEALVTEDAVFTRNEALLGLIKQSRPGFNVSTFRKFLATRA